MKQPHGAVGRFECDTDMRNHKACMVSDDTYDIAVFKLGIAPSTCPLGMTSNGASVRRASTALISAKVSWSHSNG